MAQVVDIFPHWRKTFAVVYYRVKIRSEPSQISLWFELNVLMPTHSCAQIFCNHILVVNIMVVYALTMQGTRASVAMILTNLPTTFPALHSEGWHLYDVILPYNSWWRQGMETLSTLLALCRGNPAVMVDSPHQGPMMRSFDVSFVVSLSKLLKKQLIYWWFQRPWRL